jgi:hypothetical protein
MRTLSSTGLTGDRLNRTPSTDRSGAKFACLKDPDAGQVDCQREVNPFHMEWMAPTAIAITGAAGLFATRCKHAANSTLARIEL